MKTVYTCFPGGKFKCLTMSFDDGRLQDERLVALFNTYGIRGTFNLNSGACMEREDHLKPDVFKALYAGHEVACHTVTHPTIARCPMPGVVSEVLDDRAALEKIMGYPVRGLAYPNGSVNQDICDMLRFTGIRYARIVGDSKGFALPEDPMRWMPSCHFMHDMKTLGEQFRALQKKQYQYLMYVWGHSYELDGYDAWGLMEDFCRSMGGQEDIWYATNIEIIDYMEVFSRLQFAADNSFVYNPSAAAAWIRVDNGEPVQLLGGKLTRL